MFQSNGALNGFIKSLPISCFGIKTGRGEIWHRFCVRPPPALHTSVDVPWPPHMAHLQDDDEMAANMPGAARESSPKGKQPMGEREGRQPMGSDRYGDAGPSGQGATHNRNLSSMYVVSRLVCRLANHPLC
jgi:hypothetical protein